MSVRYRTPYIPNISNIFLGLGQKKILNQSFFKFFLKSKYKKCLQNFQIYGKTFKLSSIYWETLNKSINKNLIELKALYWYCKMN